MKKTFKTMLAIVAGALCIAGCAKEEINVANGPKLVTLTAFQEGGDATKAAIDSEDSKKIDWTADDQINYFGAATGEYMTLTSGAGTASGEFKGEVTPGTSNYVLYPYQSTATCAEGVITAEVPMTQYAVANSFDPAAALMVGVVNGSRVEFKNVMSYVKVTIPSDLTNCKQVSLKAKDAWTTVAGKVKITAADATWAETDHKEGQAFVRLVPQDGDDYLTAGASYYIAILPQTMATGFELIFNDNDVIKVKQSASSSVEFGRSKTKKLGAITSFTYTVGTVTAGTMTLADRNIGAATTDSSDYGDYFAWAALRPAYTEKATPTWYWSDGFTDAHVPSNFTDIAAMLWGGSWRMPTKAEWDANTSNVTLSKGLPLGNCYTGTTYNEFYYCGQFWSATDFTYETAWYLESNGDKAKVGNCLRSIGNSIRPVMASSAPVADPNFLAGEFTVNAEGKKVKFTKGNLYCNASISPATFAFETNQYDFPTSYPTLSGDVLWNCDHVGHFFWKKWEVYSSTDDYAYRDMPYYATSGTGTTSTTDVFWCGEAHPLEVAGTQGLYVLSADEWNYLLNEYGNEGRSGNRYALAKYKDKYGIIIFPDGYTGTTSGDGIGEVNNAYNENNPSANIPDATWADMEAAGVVFLPNAGIRKGTVYTSGYGKYWSSTPDGVSNAKNVYFDAN